MPKPKPPLTPPSITPKDRIRLLRLWADKIRKCESKQFDMNSWAYCLDHTAKPAACKTAACAAGWAASIPAFRARGLTLKPHFETSQGTRLGKMRLKDGDPYTSFLVRCNGGSAFAGCLAYGDSAVALVLDIPNHVASHICQPNEYDSDRITPKMVADRIDHLADAYALKSQATTILDDVDDLLSGFGIGSEDLV